MIRIIIIIFPIYFLDQFSSNFSNFLLILSSEFVKKISGPKDGVFGVKNRLFFGLKTCFWGVCRPTFGYRKIPPPEKSFKKCRTIHRKNLFFENPALAFLAVRVHRIVRTEFGVVSLTIPC